MNQDDVGRISITELRPLIERILRRHELLSDAKSPIGSQLDILALATKDTVGPNARERAGLEWARKDRSDEKHIEFAYLSSLAAIWNEEELLVLEARFRPATPEELALRMPPETNERERTAWRGELVYDEIMGTLAHYRTHSGEEVSYVCPGDTCTRRGCPHDPNRVLVRGYFPKSPKLSEVAARCGLSVEQVRRRTTSAYEKLRDEMVRRTLLEARSFVRHGEAR